MQNSFDATSLPRLTPDVCIEDRNTYIDGQNVSFQSVGQSINQSINQSAKIV